jgi:hypothetical protein
MPPYPPMGTPLCLPARPHRARGRHAACWYMVVVDAMSTDHSCDVTSIARVVHPISVATHRRIDAGSGPVYCGVIATVVAISMTAITAKLHVLVRPLWPTIGPSISAN